MKVNKQHGNGIFWIIMLVVLALVSSPIISQIDWNNLSENIISESPINENIDSKLTGFAVSIGEDVEPVEEGNLTSLLGTHSFTKFDENINAIVLDDVLHGTFTSEIFFVGDKKKEWNEISWVEGLPYGEQLPDNKAIEQVYSGADMSNNVLLMHFNNDPSKSTKDASGENNNGACFKETCPESVEGKFGNAYDFDGTNDVIDISYSKSLNFTNALTIETWVYIDKFSEFNSIVGQAHTSFEEPFTTYGLALADNNNFYLGITTNGERVMCRTEEGSAVEGKWLHVVGVWDGVEIKTYINGKVSGDVCIKTGDLDVNDMPLSIGSYPYQRSNFLFDGKIDELAIYSRTLNIDEVKEHYIRGVTSLNVSVRSCKKNDCDKDEWKETFDNPGINKLNVKKNKYFQYKVKFVTEDENYSPELYNVSVLFDDKKTKEKDADEEESDNQNISELVNEIELVDKHNKKLNVTKTRIDNTTIEVVFDNHTIKEIKLHDVGNNTTTVNLRIEELQKGAYVQSYAIDPTQVNFTNAEITVTAVGTKLFKCKEWDFDTQTCNGTWNKIMNLVPGQNYTFNLTPEDPGFLETSSAIDVAVAPIDNTSFVLGFVEPIDNNLSFKILSANGSVILDPVPVDTTTDNDSRVTISMFNSTDFIIGWVDGPLDDVNFQFFNTSGDNTSGITNVDAIVGKNTDVSIAQLGDRFVICYANDDDNDADFQIFANNGSQILGETSADVNIGPGAPLQNIVSCSAINSTTWVYAQFDDAANDVSYFIFNSTGTALTLQNDVNNAVGERGQVDTVVLDNEDRFVILNYDVTGNDVEIHIRSSANNSNILNNRIFDDTAGSDSTVAAAKVRANDTSTEDLFVITWFDLADNIIEAAVVNRTGDNFTDAFTVEPNVSGDFQLIDVAAIDPISGNALCPGFFVVAFSNASNQGVFRGFNVNGSDWDGTCPIATSDTTLPSVKDLTPANGSTFNVSSVIEIGTNVTDDRSVGTVLANITLPNTSIVELILTNSTAAKFNNTFTIPNLTGVYIVTIIANDTSNNINNTESVVFNAVDEIPPTIVFDNFTAFVNSTFNTSILNESTLEIIEQFRLTYNVSDEIAVDSIRLFFHNTNGSSNDFCAGTDNSSVGTIGNLQNKNCFDFLEFDPDKETSTLTNTTFFGEGVSINNFSNGKFRFDVDEVYKPVFKNYPFNNTTAIFNDSIRITVNNTTRFSYDVNFIPNDADKYMLSSRFNFTTGITGSLRAFICNASFPDGNRPDNSSNCIFLGSKNSSQIVDTKVSYFFSNDTISSLGGLNNSSAVFTTDETNSSLYFFPQVFRVNVSSDQNKTFISTDRGITDSSILPQSLTTHLHWFYETDTCFEFFITANDSAGNEINSSTEQRCWKNFGANNPPISPLILTPTENQTINNLFNITWNEGVDPDGDDFNISIFLFNSDGILNTAIALNNITKGTEFFEFNTSIVSDGNYRLNISENDTFGATGSTLTSFNFTIDNTPPNVTDITPAEGTNFNQNVSVNISVNVTDNSSEVTTVLAEVRQPNGSLQNFTMVNSTLNNFTVQYNITTLAGTYNLTIIANDTLGNINSTETTFFIGVDATTPVVTTELPIAQTLFLMNETVSLTAIAVDNENVSVVQANITLPNGSVVNVNLANTAYVTDDSTILLLHLDEENTSIQDSSSLNHNVTLIGTSFTVNVTGKFGRGILFEKNGSFINITDNDLFDFDQNENFTIEAWINVTSGGSDQDVINKLDESNTSVPGYELKVNLNDMPVLDINNGTDEIRIAGTTNVSDGQLHHIAATRDVTAQECKIYVDGVLENTVSCGGNLSSELILKVGNSFDLSEAFNGTIDEVRISNISRQGFSPNYFNTSFTNLLLRGNYNITFIANDTNNNINSSTVTNFTRTSLDTIDLISREDNSTNALDNFTFLNYSTNVTANVSEILNLSITIFDHRIITINITNHSNLSDDTILRIDDNIIFDSNASFTEFGIDPTLLNFTTGTVTVNATGTRLMKCGNWNFTEQDCIDNNWTQLLSLTPGQTYTFNLSTNDPGFLETSAAVDTALAPIDNESFVIAFVDPVYSNISFRIMNTTGTVIVNTVNVDTTADNDSRVAVSMINSTDFIIAWVDGPDNDISIQAFNTSGNNTSGIIDVSTNAGQNTDVGVAQLGDRFAVCYANDVSNDAEFIMFANNLTNITNESRVDLNIGPGLPLQNLVSCSAINNSRWVYAYFDDAANDISYFILNETNGTLTGEEDVDVAAGERGQVDVASLDNDKFAIVHYDLTGNDIEISIRGVNNSTIASNVIADDTAGSDSTVAIAAVRANASTTEDLLVIVWFDNADNIIEAAVYNSTADNFTDAFTVEPQPDGDFQLLDVIGRDSITGNAICPGFFVVAFSNSSDQGVFKGFNANGTEWDGRCPVTVEAPEVAAAPAKAGGGGTGSYLKAAVDLKCPGEPAEIQITTVKGFAVAYANVKIYDEASGNLVSETTTDKSGLTHPTLNKAGLYIVDVYRPGYYTLIESFKLEECKTSESTVEKFPAEVIPALEGTELTTESKETTIDKIKDYNFDQSIVFWIGLFIGILAIILYYSLASKTKNHEKYIKKIRPRRSIFNKIKLLFAGRVKKVHEIKPNNIKHKEFAHRKTRKNWIKVFFAWLFMPIIKSKVRPVKLAKKRVKRTKAEKHIETLGRTAYARKIRLGVLIKLVLKGIFGVLATFGSIFTFRRTTTKDTYLKLLKFIDTRRIVTYIEIVRFLRLREYEVDRILKDLCGKNNKFLVRTASKKEGYTYKITLRGLDYIDRNYSQKLTRVQIDYYQIIALTIAIGILIAIVYFFAHHEKFLSLISNPNGRITGMGVFTIILFGVLLMKLIKSIIDLFFIRQG